MGSHIKACKKNSDEESDTCSPLVDLFNRLTLPGTGIPFPDSDNTLCYSTVEPTALSNSVTYIIWDQHNDYRLTDEAVKLYSYEIHKDGLGPSLESPFRESFTKAFSQSSLYSLNYILSNVPFRCHDPKMCFPTPLPMISSSIPIHLMEAYGIHGRCILSGTGKMCYDQDEQKWGSEISLDETDFSTCENQDSLVSTCMMNSVARLYDLTNGHTERSDIEKWIRSNSSLNGLQIGMMFMAIVLTTSFNPFISVGSSSLQGIYFVFHSTTLMALVIVMFYAGFTEATICVTVLTGVASNVHGS